MPKPNMNDMLKRRMAATQQASELRANDEAYQQIFREKVPVAAAHLCDLPLNKLVAFFTVDIGFRPYSKEKLAGWSTIPAEVVEADDTRAVVIASSTNLIQRQGLSIVERGKAYKALLDAKNRNGQRNAAKETFGDNRQSYNARKLVAEFFGVTEYEIRKAVKLTQLIPELADILENNPKQLNLACADLIADYDTESQKAFIEICSIEGYQINKAAMQHITRKCPPPTVDRQAVYAVWHEARAAAEKRLTAPPRKISFDRKQFAPYLEKFSSDREIEKLFLEFLRERAG